MPSAQGVYLINRDCLAIAGLALAPFLLHSPDYRLAFWLTNITFEPLAQVIGKLRVSDEAAKVVGELVLKYWLET